MHGYTSPMDFTVPKLLSPFFKVSPTFPLSQKDFLILHRYDSSKALCLLIRCCTETCRLPALDYIQPPLTGLLNSQPKK